MWLLDKFLGNVIREGQLVVTDNDGKTYEYGNAVEGSPPLHIRLTHRKAANPESLSTTARDRRAYRR
jgi:cyclopropane-fatty-acyl-phospholipid synthase